MKTLRLGWLVKWWRRLVEMAHVGPLMRHHVALHHLFHLFHHCVLHGLESFLKISLLIMWRLHIRFHAFSPSRCIPGCWPSLSIRRRWSVDLVLRGAGCEIFGIPFSAFGIFFGISGWTFLHSWFPHEPVHPPLSHLPQRYGWSSLQASFWQPFSEFPARRKILHTSGCLYSQVSPP